MTPLSSRCSTAQTYCRSAPRACGHEMTLTPEFQPHNNVRLSKLSTTVNRDEMKAPENENTARESTHGCFTEPLKRKGGSWLNKAESAVLWCHKFTPRDASRNYQLIPICDINSLGHSQCSWHFSNYFRFHSYNTSSQQEILQIFADWWTLLIFTSEKPCLSKMFLLYPVTLLPCW